MLGSGRDGRMYVRQWITEGFNGRHNLTFGHKEAQKRFR